MPLHFKAKLLVLLDSLERQDMSTLSPQQSRANIKKAFKKFLPFIHYPAEPLFQVEDKWVPTATEEQFKVRVYKPRDAANLPLLLFFHGGGFVHGDIEMADLSCRACRNKTIAWWCQ